MWRLSGQERDQRVQAIRRMRTGLLSLLTINHLNLAGLNDDYASQANLPTTLDEIKLFMREKAR